MSLPTSSPVTLAPLAYSTTREPMAVELRALVYFCVLSGAVSLAAHGLQGLLMAAPRLAPNMRFGSPLPLHAIVIVLGAAGAALSLVGGVAMLARRRLGRGLLVGAAILKLLVAVASSALQVLWLARSIRSDGPYVLGMYATGSLVNCVDQLLLPCLLLAFLAHPRFRYRQATA